MLVCTNCRRGNPNHATFCFFDGAALMGTPGHKPVRAKSMSFTTPFTFPSGPACRDFDQLALGCQENWSIALQLLRKGQLEKFLFRQGRPDLALAAREAARFPDRDRGLDQFLACIPSQAVKAPQLRVEPATINLGIFRIGEDRSFALDLENLGMRLLYGSVTVEEAPWLVLGSKPGTRQKLFQCGGKLTIPVHVIGKRLRGGNKPLQGRLVIESNGGIFTVSINGEVPVKKYPSGGMAGATSPRQLAERAKNNPRDAASHFQSGQVAQWYKDNGWIYPVRGPAAAGLGAVQQYFEALGLTPPPKVQVAEKRVELAGEPEQTLSHNLEVKSEEKRPVYAHAVSDQPWLEVGRARLSGRVAQIPLRVSKVPDRLGETLHARLTVTSNGNQRFVIPVTLNIGEKENVFGIPPAAPAKGTTMVARPKSSRPWEKLHLLPALLLLMALLMIVAWDLLRGPVILIDDTSGHKLPDVKVQPVIPPEPLSQELYLGTQFTAQSSRFGFSCLKLRDPLNPGEPKRLTRDLRGMSHNTCFRVDGFEYLFGREIPGVRWMRNNSGGIIKEAQIPNGIYGEAVPSDRGWRSVMHDEHHRVTVSQDVQIVIGESTRLYDTALVTFLITNEDRTPHTVGLRVMLDTYVGSEDGVPIYVPPHGDPVREGFMLKTMKVFPQKDIPDYVSAVEKGDLTARDSTVAVMGLRLRNIETPEKLVICRWPQNSESRWDWKYEPMNANPNVPDSCVVLYWGQFNMNPGEQRRLGFTYGLGKIAGVGLGGETIADGEHGQLRLQVHAPKVNKPFIVTTMVRTSRNGERVRLILPEGIELAPGQTIEKPVPPPSSAGYSAVSWRVKARSGKYTLKARVDSIGTASVELDLKKGIFD